MAAAAVAARGRSRSRIAVLAQRAIRALEADPTVSVADAADAVGIHETTIVRHWRRTHDEPPRYRLWSSFLALCAVMRSHVHRHEQTAAEIFAAVRDDFGTCNERRLWRALTWLIARGQVVRRGTPHHGCVYVRIVRLRA